MNELKPCPFCGGKAEIQQFANPQNYYCVRCTDCGCSTDGYRRSKTESTEAENKAANAAAWNRRTEPENVEEVSRRYQAECNYDHAVEDRDALRAELEQLKPENKALTVEQLRKMDGEPVWIVLLNIAKPVSCEIITEVCKDGIRTVGANGNDYASFSLYEKTWLSYAHKPEGSGNL
jgi:Lar family restriction alleviation protein